MTKPITPDEIATYRKENIPDVVFKVYNDLIAENFRSGKSEFTYSTTKNRLAYELSLTEGAVKSAGYLDIEDIYRESGWEVTENTPDYTESYDGYWTFKRKK